MILRFGTWSGYLVYPDAQTAGSNVPWYERWYAKNIENHRLSKTSQQSSLSAGNCCEYWCTATWGGVGRAPGLSVYFNFPLIQTWKMDIGQHRNAQQSRYCHCECTHVIWYSTWYFPIYRRKTTFRRLSKRNYAFVYTNIFTREFHEFRHGETLRTCLHRKSSQRRKVFISYFYL